MNHSSPLAELRPIHLPELIGFWPLASGYWLLLCLALILLFGAITLGYFWFKKQAPKREALAILKTIQADYLQTRQAQNAATLVSQILKRVGLAYFPAEALAALHGEAWWQFLHNTAKNIKIKVDPNLLTLYPYVNPTHERWDLDKDSESAQIQELFKFARAWIKHPKVLAAMPQEHAQETKVLHRRHRC